MIRRRSREVRVGTLGIGGDNPLRIQSMTTAPPADVDATAAECARLHEAGCELTRVSTPRVSDAALLGELKKRLRRDGIPTPISADIHFMPQAAMEAALHADKVRINPGNFADRRSADEKKLSDSDYGKELERISAALRPLLERLRSRGAALRIGTNHGSLSERILAKYGNTARGMAESAMEYLRICRAQNFDDVILSMKSSNPRVMVQANRILVNMMSDEGFECPLHLGVTEAGVGEDGRLRSAAGIGALLCDGIGDTIRVSLAEAPEAEIPVARALAELFRDAPRGAARRPPELTGRRKSAVIGILGGTNPVRVCGAAEGARVPTPPGAIPVEILVSDVPGLAVVVDSEPLPASFDCSALMAVITDPARSLEFTRALTTRLTDQPIVLCYRHRRPANLDLCAAVALGAPLIEGIGDAVLIEDGGSPAAGHELAVSILQNSLTRISRVEIIACPSCGRTLFDLPSVAREVKRRFSHLKNVKIAVMGCIVNGIGEMADADFGFVGGPSGTVNLYHDGALVEGPLPIDEAYARLESLIKREGRWN